MSGFFGRLFGNIKLTTTIIALAVFGIAAAIIAVLVAMYINLAATTQIQAQAAQASNIRIATSAFQGQLSGTKVFWNDDGTLQKIETWQLPTFNDTKVVDAMARVTGDTIAVFAWDKEAKTFVVKSTTLKAADGTPVTDLTIVPGDAAYDALSTALPFSGQINVLGSPYYTYFHPIQGISKDIVGAIMVGSPTAKTAAAVMSLLQLLLVVGGIAMLALGAAIVVASRQLLKPIPRLSGVMNEIANNRFDVTVPYTGYGNELGKMARSIEVFRNNARHMIEVDEEQGRASTGRRVEREQMMASLQRAFGEVVDAGIAGDFSRRVDDSFADEALNILARGVNKLVQTMDNGLKETGDVLSALAHADLSVRMDGQYEGAFAKLQSDTNAVAGKLGEIVGQLQDTSRQLRTATGEILTGANDLSERTTKQAATIEETSATMEQLAATVLQNAERAKEANGVAQSVTRTAEEGGEVMSQANLAMERITTSSGKISNIIGLIDDIAFQTNLLALNASVEAARAGDAGKGFAVVAVEVRRLAQSAASASSDVKVLIEQSATEVSAGSRLVANAAEKLTQMLGAARSSNQLMDSIAKESRQQASAIDEVNTAVRQMDQMTQHNAALVEEINAAIEQTERQAGELDRIVDVFQLEAAPQNAARGQQRRPMRAAS
ncbi:methyl-accepting chemotaxis protein [Devosia sp.]|uniref:methyl-accepting chemotaxis protein n=1 Tax=Devosia sp. TaxID=1871048 RepID=UPI00326316DE